MRKLYLGADIGSTHTRILLADETGQAAGLGVSGAGNHEVVGYDGLIWSLTDALEQALHAAGATRAEIAGAGFGVSGYDWDCETAPTLEAIGTLGLTAPVAAVNDTILGLLAGTTEGWGLAIVSGTGCNCWGWDRTHTRVGRVTGGSLRMGEAAGAGELMVRAVQAVAHAWTGRGQPTILSDLFCQQTGEPDLLHLLEGLNTGRCALIPADAPLVFQAAEMGDAVALDLVRWAGTELGELACAVIRQMGFEGQSFEVVLTGGMFNAGDRLIQPLRETILAKAPGARLVRLKFPPVVGACVLALNQAGIQPATQFRADLAESLQRMGGELPEEL
ncbi:MAG TPA: BadF/BadG/BcrA/BcrD ATPase family protein [Anaerolineaceae bacterium]|nr:BadF/BadG/BcrA/BcrD ATPase family protein [Anaerolineaceae bacterium]